MTEAPIDRLDDAWIPERVEVGDDHFPYWHKLTVIALATGEEISHVIMCDQSAGIVERYRLDADNRPFVDPATEDAARETLHSRFKMVWSEEAQAELEPARVAHHLQCHPPRTSS